MTSILCFFAIFLPKSELTIVEAKKPSYIFLCFIRKFVSIAPTWLPVNAIKDSSLLTSTPSRSASGSVANPISKVLFLNKLRKPRKLLSSSGFEDLT